MHPDWNPFSERFDADIAAIFVDDKVPYTKFIRPICLSPTELDVISGFVAGWGQGEDTSKNHESLPKHISISIHNNEHCFLESPEFITFASKRTICAGDRDMRGRGLRQARNKILPEGTRFSFSDERRSM